MFISIGHSCHPALVYFSNDKNFNLNLPSHFYELKHFIFEKYIKKKMIYMVLNMILLC